MNFDNFLKGIKKAERVVKELIQLTLEIGTLVMVIEMIIQSIR